ncbi:MAG: FMN-binding protein [Streptosporangiaceae bacterium]|nr:FMN-binding protein [Streptosporangiaceae bacterium]
MKGAPWLILAGTVAGLIGVLSFHTRPAQQSALRASSAQGPGGDSGAASASLPASARATPGANGHGGGPVRSALGPDVQFGYGLLDVKVTVTGTRITDVSVPSLQTAEPTSQQISEQAIPVLRSEVLSAQGAGIDAVSGATFTSEAYAQSLQAALDRLHVR